MTPNDYMRKAARALTSASLLATDGDHEGACNRAYYAMFDAAHAALLASGASVDGGRTRTHRGLIAAFGLHLVQPGTLSADLGRALNRVERARLLADYTGEETDAETARHAVDEASRFILAIRTRFNFPE